MCRLRLHRHAIRATHNVYMREQGKVGGGQMRDEQKGNPEKMETYAPTQKTPIQCNICRVMSANR